MSLAKKYKEVLSKSGIAGEIDKDGDVIFKQIISGNRLTFFISVYEKDKEYLSIVLPAFWSIDSDTEMAVAIQVCGKVTRECKAVKVYVHPQQKGISASIEFLIMRPDDLEHFLPRIMGMFESALKRVKELMENLMGQVEDA